MLINLARLACPLQPSLHPGERGVPLPQQEDFRRRKNLATTNALLPEDQDWFCFKIINLAIETHTHILDGVSSIRSSQWITKQS